jgi:hypothetical protein
MEQVTIKIRWYGPYTEEEIARLDGVGNGLYMFTGQVRYQREEPEIQYFGITEGSYQNRFRGHHKLQEINRELKIWLGEIVYPSEYERKHLEVAEAMMIYFWQPRLNEKKTLVSPRLSTTVISHWFTKEGRALINQRGIYKHLPDVICWDGSHWRTGNLSVFDATA